MNRVLLPVLVALITIPFMNPPALARAMESGDAAAARKATPAVVNISTWKLRQSTGSGESPRRVKTHGSGFIIQSDGIIVTNKHVIDGALDIKVLFSDGTRVPARLVAVAAMLDLAVV
jgi:S1-C subfamily serine protease